jgi:hypothetical protein
VIGCFDRLPGKGAKSFMLLIELFGQFVRERIFLTGVIPKIVEFYRRVSIKAGMPEGEDRHYFE